MNEQEKATSKLFKDKKFEEIFEPKKTGINAIIIAVVSFFIFGKALATGAIMYGLFGAYSSIKLKAGFGKIMLNILAVILGFTSITLLAILKSI